MVKLLSDYFGKPIIINLRTDSIKKFALDNGYNFPVYYGIKFDTSNTYGVRSILETVFINTDGSLYDTQVGAMSDVVLKNCIKQMEGEEE